MTATFDYKKKQDKLFAKLFTRYPALVKMWARHSDFVKFTDSPWTELADPVSQYRLALVTTAGVHHRSQTPFNMLDPSGDPSFREIPADAPDENLMITHDYYDHTDADRDINIVLPIELVLELRDFGDIGDVNHPRALSPGFPLGHPIAFPGQTQRQLKVLRMLLKCLEEVDAPGSVVKCDFSFSDDFASGSLGYKKTLI